MEPLSNPSQSSVPWVTQGPAPSAARASNGASIAASEGPCSATSPPASSRSGVLVPSLESTPGASRGSGGAYKSRSLASDPLSQEAWASLNKALAASKAPDAPSSSEPNVHPEPPRIPHARLGKATPKKKRLLMISRPHATRVLEVDTSESTGGGHGGPRWARCRRVACVAAATLHEEGVHRHEPRHAVPPLGRARKGRQVADENQGQGNGSVDSDRPADHSFRRAPSHSALAARCGSTPPPDPEIGLAE